MKRIIVILALLLAGSAGTFGQEQSPAFAEKPRRPSLDSFAKPWHTRLPRTKMLEAWDRLKAVEIPGEPVDQRFDISGQTLYVSPDGDDAAAGSREHPWKTLVYAAEQLKPGMVVYLLSGTYYGPATVSAEATKDAPCALRAAEGHTVYVTYPDSFIAEKKAKVATVKTEGRREVTDKDGIPLHYTALINIRGTYVEVSGLHLIGARDLLPHNLYSENGVCMLGKGGEGCRILYNEIEAVGHCGVKEMGHGGHSYLIEGNYIHDVGHTFHDHGTYTPSDNVVQRKNLIVNCTGWGVHAYSTPKRQVITHNILAGNDQHGAVLGGPEAVIAHNVFYRNNKGGLFFFRSGCKNAIVKNNLFFEKIALPYDCCGWRKQYPSGNVADHNILAPGTKLGTPAPEDVYGEHNLVADPLVENADMLDFRPKSGSPCLDAGQAVGGEQFTGKAPDIGLYELGSVG